MTPTLRPIDKLDRGRHVFLQCGSEQRESPLFVLDQGGSPPVALHLELRVNGSIVDRASTGNEQGIDFDVTIAELNRIPCVQPIAAHGMDSRTVSPHPVAHQYISIRVEVTIVVVPIDVAARAVCRNSIGQRSLDPQIEFWQSGEASQIEAGAESRAPRRRKRGRIVRGNGIVINSQPLPKQRNAVRGRPAPPTTTVRVKPNSRLRVGLKLFFSPWKKGLGERRCPWSLPK